MAFTKVTGPGIHTLANITSHNINSSGIITATKFVGPLEASSGSTGTFDSLTVTGNVSVGGTLTYEDVTNIDSVGIVTAQNGLRIAAGGINVTGVSTFAGAIDANGALDVDGQTDLDVLNVSETATFSALVDVNNRIDIVGGANIDQANVSGVSTFAGTIDANGALDVDGQTDLDVLNVAETATFSSLVDVNNRIDVVGGANIDQVNVTGVSTFAGAIDANGALDVDGQTDLDVLNVSDLATFAADVSIADKIVHTGDTNTAIRFSDADTISFETGGSPRAFINSAGDLTIGGSAGTLGKVYIRQAADTDTEGLTLLNSGSSNSFRLFLGDSSGAVAHFGHGGQKQVNITQAGNVGIATAAPGNPLHVYHATTNEVARFESGDATCYIGFRDSASHATGTSRPLLGAKGDDMFFQTGGSERVRIRDNGNVSIASSLAVTGVTTSSSYDLSAIDKSISDTATDIFVYDTRKDSDGGAWRKRTSHTSWYNEGASATRGARKEFPAVAVIVTEGSAINIYDGDDPEMPLWMQFISGSGQDEIFHRPQYWTSSSVFALNGIICVTNQTGAAESTLVLNYVSDSVRLYPISGYASYGGDYSLGIAGRSDSSGEFKVISQNIYGDEAWDVAMTVLPNAPIDDATGLPIPTIAVAHGHGVSVITDNGEVFDTRATTSGYVPSRKVEFSDSGEYLYIIQDPSLIYSYKTSSFTTDRSSGTLAGYAGISFFSGYVNSSGAAADTKLARSNDLTINIGHANTGLALLYPDYTYTSNSLDNGSRKMICRIAKDFNSGWMVGDIKGAYLADTDDTNLTGSELLTNGDFSNGTTGWTERETGGTLTVSSGQATMAYSSGATSWQITGTVVVGKTYTISFDIVSCTTTSVQAYYDNGSGAVAISVAGTAGKHGATFVATSTSVTIWPRIFASGNMVVDNFSLREAVDDRTKNNEGLAIHGSITKTAVATGAELVSYGPFSTSNRLRGTYRGTSAYPSIHHYETGDFHVMFWMNHDGTDTHQTIVSRDNREFDISILANTNYNRRIRVYASNSSNSLQTFDSTDDPFLLNTWTHVCVNYTNGDTASVYLNGVLNKTGALDYDIDDTTNGLNIGSRNTSGSYNYAATATKLALVRIGGTAPSPEQIEKIYEDEKKLFAPNAKCTLYGSSDAVTAVAYDDSNDTVHVGTSGGRSDFTGLNRINNTTTAVTTAISASNGLIIEQ